MKENVMFTKSKETNALVDAITNALNCLKSMDPTSREYADALSKIEKLNAIKAKKPSVSPDTIAIVLGNLVGILMILNHERAHVVVSKALGFVMKIR
jgi:hypothetical protein